MPAGAEALARLSDGGGANLPIDAPALATEPEELAEAPAPAAIRPAGPTLDDLLAKAEAHGFSRAHLVTAARHYCGKDDLARLAPEEIAEIDRRLSSHIERDRAGGAGRATEGEPEAAAEGAVAGRGRKAQA